jgi:iron complex transport system substrate-binding protein
MALQPDLVVGFSDIQASIATQLIELGITVWINNYRSVDGILTMIGQLGALVGKQEKALELIDSIRSQIREIGVITETWKTKPKVYFEEWYDPLITNIRWVSEIVELAGGIDIFSEKSKGALAKERIIADTYEVVRRNPDIILASWCGKMFKKDRLVQRPDWSMINAVKSNQVVEIKSEIILQPGHAALQEGLPLIHQIFANWHEGKNRSPGK